ncbi:unnamed protein product [Rhizoctonia solani]|uniref:Uncharacterized protein n=1 Tax=Rhizoctonia solani TaxID=456999 RepID=A0A8H3GPQ0_9AGAM|nr:unnamed protein product [Rhizoctonia solani]
MSTSKVNLPDIPSYVAKAFPIRIQANPHHREVESESYEWFDKYGVYTDDKREKFLSPEFGLMAALLCPTVDASPLRIMMDFTLWFFSFKSMVDKNEFDSPEKLKGATDALMRAANDANAPSVAFKPAAMLQSYV